MRSTPLPARSNGDTLSPGPLLVVRALHLEIIASANTGFEPARHSRSSGVKMRLSSERLIPRPHRLTPRAMDLAALDFLRSRSRRQILIIHSQFGKVTLSQR